ncbi:MAG: hypothetical protein RKE49_13945 [Oceanicaulis sp.]
MARCDQCGHDYHDPLIIEKGGERYTFDSFECAAHRLAPTCANCGVRVLGHGLEADGGAIFCCAHCASQMGESGARA